jgi:hypothetical protein
VELDSGKRLEAKSKVDETEKERPWCSGRLRMEVGGLSPPPPPSS